MTDQRGVANDPLHPPFEAYTGDKPYIFISYGHRDSAVVYPELLRLHKLGYRIWYDEGIDPGNEWPDEIAKAVKNCAHFIVMISPRSVASPNVVKEIRYALRRDRLILAIHIAETELPDGLEMEIGSTQAILRYRMAPDRYERKMAKVLLPETLDPDRVVKAPAAEAAMLQPPTALPPAPAAAPPAPPPAPPAPAEAPTIRISRPSPASAVPKKVPQATPSAPVAGGAPMFGTRMFYTLEEAAQKLGVSEAFLGEKVYAGELREFRDGPRRMFKCSDIDSLALRESHKPPEGEGLLDLTLDDDALDLTGPSDDSGLLDLTREDDSGIRLDLGLDDIELLPPGGDSSDVIELVPPKAAPPPAPVSLVPPVRQPFHIHLPPQLPDKPAARACWGLDVGNSGVAAVRLKAVDGEVQAAGLFLQPFSRLLSEPGVDAKGAIVAALRQFAKKCLSDGEGVFAAVAGRLVERGCFAVPPDQLGRVLTGDAALRSAIHLPTELGELAWSSQAVPTRQTSAADVGVMAIRMKDRAAVTAPLEEAGLRVDGLVPGPVAAFNAIAYERVLKRGAPPVLILDIGALSTDVILADGEVIRMADIPIGGDHFTGAIARDFKLTFAKAEELKRTAAESKYARQIFQSMRQVYRDFTAAIAKPLKEQAPMLVGPGRLPSIAMGPMSRLPGLCKFTSTEVGISLASIDGFTRIKALPNVAKSLKGHEHQCGVACGLALQGLGLGMLTFNLAARPKSKSLLGRLFGG